MIIVHYIHLLRIERRKVHLIIFTMIMVYQMIRDHLVGRPLVQSIGSGEIVCFLRWAHIRTILSFQS